METAPYVVFKPARTPHEWVNLYTSTIGWERCDHAIAMHGETFFIAAVHEEKHKRNDKAVYFLKDGANTWVGACHWLNDVMMVRHEHKDGAY